MSKSSSRYTIKNLIQVDNIEIAFEYPIAEVLEISDMLIVRIKSPIGIIFNENVFGVSLPEKKIKWQIAKIKYRSETYCPYVGIKSDRNKLYLNNWCDSYLIVNPETGEVIEKGETR